MQAVVAGQLEVELVETIAIGARGLDRRIDARHLIGVVKLHRHAGHAFTQVGDAILVVVDKDEVTRSDWTEQTDIDSEVSVRVIRIIRRGVEAGLDVATGRQ